MDKWVLQLTIPKTFFDRCWFIVDINIVLTAISAILDIKWSQMSVRHNYRSQGKKEIFENENIMDGLCVQ